MEEFGFGLTEMAGNEGNQFWPEWNGLEWRKLVVARLEWLGIEEVSFGLTEMPGNEGSRFWPEWNGLECRKLVLA
jgi:hypothetical protein